MCRAEPCYRLDLVPKGAPWLSGVDASTGYNHHMPINGRSCANNNSITGGAWTAGSRHPGGANVLFADGHVRFLKETMPLSVWRALGSRNGGEIAPADLR